MKYTKKEHIILNIKEKNSLEENTLVVKDNKIIRTKVNVKTVDEGRLLSCFISMIRTDDKELKEDYSLEIKKIITDYSGRGYAKFREFCRNFINCSVEIECENKKGEQVFITIPFFTMAKYESGRISISFNQKLKQYLLRLQEKFTEYSLEEYKKLSTVYSQRLFEILKSYSKLEYKDIELKELHRYLNTPTSHSKDFFRFRTKILEPAIKEITSKTNFYFEYEPIKGGKGGRTSPVIAIRFIFSKKKIEPVKEKKEKEDKEKTVKNNNKNFFTAWNCVKSCKGNCDTLSKKPNKAACTICKTKNLLGEVLKNQEEHCSSEKITPKKTTYKSGGVEVEQANFLYLVEQTKIQKKS